MSLIAGILSKELTWLPGILTRYFGKFYSNALCNGCTWLFIIWYILHFGIDFTLNELFRKMRYKEYNRTRLKHALWYLGFFSTAFIYTGATLFQNKVDVLNFRKMHNSTYGDVSSDLVLGFMVMFTFFLHTAFWEIMENDSKSVFSSYILLCLVMLVAFFLRIFEVIFTLVAFISITQVSMESAKLFYVVAKKNNLYMSFVATIFFGLGISSFAFGYLIGVPLVFLIPFGRKIAFAHLPAGYIPFTLLMAGWYFSEISTSPLFKLVNHTLFHKEKSTDCCGHFVECSLFRPRNDMAYSLMQLRNEIKEREERILALKKQSKKGMLIQTIKCMVNLKRKIHARRASNEKAQDKSSEQDKDYTTEEGNSEKERLRNTYIPNENEETVIAAVEGSISDDKLDEKNTSDATVEFNSSDNNNYTLQYIDEDEDIDDDPIVATNK